MSGDDAVTDERRRVSTGVGLLDAMLGGGLPAERSTLAVGEPGTGKSTLGMNFLQAGLDRGEDCLLVSTEQTVEELRDSFAGYEFDLDDQNLTYTSVHARPGSTMEAGETLTLRTLSDDDTVGESFAAPFETEYVRDHLAAFAPKDRVLFDSVSGLSVLAEDRSLFRRSVLDLIRLFTDEFGATTLFTAEEHGEESPLRFTTHGVIRLHRERVADDPHRFLTVEKMRGVDHDRRTVEIEFDDDGVTARPRRRSQPPALKQHRHAPVGVTGLDELTGGGFVRDGVLLEHDGRANLSALLSTVVAAALDRGESVTLLPTTDLGPDRLTGLLDGHGQNLQATLGEELFVLDPVGAWDHGDDGVFDPGGTPTAFTDVLDTIDHRSDADTSFALLNAPGIVHTLGSDAACELAYDLRTRLGAEDTLLEVLNPAVVGERVAEFHVDAAKQVLRTWVTDSGLQYVSLEKSPCGFVGSTSLVEYRRDPPYVSVQSPPRDRETPMGGEE